VGLEIEAKMRLTDADAVRDALHAHHAEARGSIFETNTFFDDDQGQLKSGDRGLRIRIEQRDGTEPVVTITHKGPRTQSQLKSRHESEVQVDDAHRAAELLNAMGYQPVLTFEKRRERWLLDECRIELDTLPKVGQFIEIEGPSDEAVMHVREKLGLYDAPLVRTSYAAMLSAYVREHDLRTALIRFEDADADAHQYQNGQTASAT
jgi:adenylate cyclase class 2